ncbi:pilus assembly protein TadG-related protein [Pararhodobacter sp. CCB-MM2]|uniref:pilus assembly protein TadG-related protein n=1 Tax=Pararhodobacter sp. CCB-MM2 TaxID=1786003 RepID=UPI0009F2C979|nr:pilus assembly protein TadG-related protein [Pararhodobacter sp. CCB-MM2]
MVALSLRAGLTLRPLPRSLVNFERSEKGAVAVLFIILLPALLLAGGMAIDVMNINAERRYVQAQADLAAISAARHLSSAEASRSAARATVAANGAVETFALPDGDIVFGSSAALGNFVPAADQTITAGATAVSVAVTAPVRLFLLDMFLPEEGLVVRREAVAAVEPPRVSFSLSNCLAELAVLNGLLRPLIGAEVDVLCSGRGIDTQVDLFETLGEFSLNAAVLTPSGEEATYGDVLDAYLPVSDILTEVTGLPVAPGAGTVRLGDALILSDDLRRLTADTPVHAFRIQQADLVLVVAELLAMNVISLDTELDLGPIADLGASIRVGEPRRMVLNVIPGSPDARAQTSQIRVEFNEINILGLFKLRLNVQLANASVTLSDQGNACAPNPSDEIAVFDPVDASLIDVELMTQAYGLPLASSALGMQVDTASLRETRRVAFTRQDYDEAPVVTIGPTGPAAEEAAVALLRDTVTGMLDSTADALEDAADLQSCTNILTCAQGALNALASLLTSTATTLIASSVNIANGVPGEGSLTNEILEGLIGLELARADLELIEVICPTDVPRLVR